MTTLTLGRAIDAEDFLFVALNDSSYADWRASRNTSEAMAERYVEKAGHETLGGRIKKFFSRKQQNKELKQENCQIKEKIQQEYYVKYTHNMFFCDPQN